MKRFLVFVWDQFYPEGGMNDFQASFNELETAKKFTDNILKYDWYQVYDLERNCSVYEGEYSNE